MPYKDPVKNRACMLRYSRTPEAIAKAKVRAQSVEGKSSRRLAVIKLRYGISKQEYQELLLKAGKYCHICKSEFSLESKSANSMVIDHNHSTGKVRGIICHSCNVLLGNSKENTEILTSAITYLKKHYEI